MTAALAPVMIVQALLKEIPRGKRGDTDGKDNRHDSENGFVAKIRGVDRRFERAHLVFKNMKNQLGSGKTPVNTDTILVYKKRVRGDTLSLIINRQLQFLSNQYFEEIGRYLGDCAITSSDSALILGVYQNTNKSGNKSAKVREKELPTLKIADKPTNTETLFSRTKVAWDFLVSEKAPPPKVKRAIKSFCH